MRFDSWIYLCLFLPAMLAIYSGLTRQRVMASNLLILAGSYLFYGWHTPWILLPLFASSFFDFYLGCALHVSKRQAWRNFYLVMSLVLNLGLLFTFKYATWITSALHARFAFIPAVEVPLPPGISFYTFQSLSFIIDIYRRTLVPRATLIDYLAFVSFFPHLIAGPILKAREILPQLERVRAAVPSRVAALCVFMIAWGLFKKLVCADNLGHLVEDAQKTLTTPGAGLIVALAFTFQIYADFSAYSDIARGTARLFGVRIPRNFLTPYISRSPSEFWRRWHISLSTWFRDYLYISLGGNRGSSAALVRNLMITMALAGLWHGAGPFFLLWGLYHGALLVFYRLVPLDRMLVNRLGHVGIVVAWLLMFVLIVFGWVLFFVDSTTKLNAILSSAAALLSTSAPPGFFALGWGLVLFATPLILSDFVGARFRREFVDIYPVMSVATKSLLYVALFYGTLFFAARRSYDFIYFQF